jgi:hypothetical protein
MTVRECGRTRNTGAVRRDVKGAAQRLNSAKIAGASDTVGGRTVGAARNNMGTGGTIAGEARANRTLTSSEVLFQRSRNRYARRVRRAGRSNDLESVVA